jgi:hypothetical protein
MTTNEKQSSQKRLELLLYAKKTCIINPKTMNRNLSNYLYFEEEVFDTIYLPPKLFLSR